MFWTQLFLGQQVRGNILPEANAGTPIHDTESNLMRGTLDLTSLQYSNVMSSKFVNSCQKCKFDVNL